MNSNYKLLNDIQILINEIESYSNKGSYISSSDLNYGKYCNFMSWLDENGAIYKEFLIYPVLYGKYKIPGAQARQKIQENCGLLYIPKNLIIDSCKICQTDEFIKIHEKVSQIKNLNILNLTIFLLLEYTSSFHGKISFYQPYLNLISADVPIFWGEKLLSELDDENFVSEILETKNDLLQYYSILIETKILDSKVVDIYMFMTYYSFVLSRNFCVNDSQMLLVPFADSLNHNHVNVKYECFDSTNLICKYTLEFDDSILLNPTDNFMILESLQNLQHGPSEIESEIIDNDCIKFSEGDYFLISTNTSQIYEKDTQVYNFYGHYSNEYLLKWYGFCYFNNKHDYTSIILNIPKYEDFQFDKLLEVFFRDYLNESIKDNICFNTLIFKLKPNKVNTKFLKYVRFFYFYEIDELETFMNYTFDLQTELEILDRAVNLLEITFQKKNYSFPLQDDYILLRKLFSLNDISNCGNEMRVFYILVYRITQKLNILKQKEYLRSISKILIEFNEKRMSNHNFENGNYYKLELFKDFNLFLEDCNITDEIKNYFKHLLKYSQEI